MTKKLTDKFKSVLGKSFDDADKENDRTLEIAAKSNKSLNIDIPESNSILIATPMYGGMCTGHYTIAIMNSIDTLKKLKVETLLASVMNESLIPRARNELVRLFLEQTKCSHLMFVDSDMYFDEQAIATLYKANKDIACGIYPKKEIDWGKVLTASKMGKTDLENHASSFVLNLPHGVEKAEPDQDGWLEVRHGGTGFMLIKREVFKQLAPKVPEYRASTKKNKEGKFTKPLTKQFFDTSIDETGCLLSEDYHFCNVWRKHGGKVFANVNIKFNHIGTQIFGGKIQ